MSKRKLKLKGNNAKKLRPKQKKKIKATLNRMQKTREIDTQNLRIIIEAKLKWAEIEKLKGIRAVDSLQKQVLRLEGVITAFKELLESKKEEKE